MNEGRALPLWPARGCSLRTRGLWSVVDAIVARWRGEAGWVPARTQEQSRSHRVLHSSLQYIYIGVASVAHKSLTHKRVGAAQSARHSSPKK